MDSDIPSPTFAAAAPRRDGPDVLRGAAVLAMIVYHALWFSTDAGLLHLDFQSPVLRLTQRGIAGTFYVLVGISLALAHHTTIRWRSFWRRELELAVCAAVVTTASGVLDAHRTTWFGILHNILVSSLVALPLRRRPYWAAFLGIAILGLANADAPLGHQAWMTWTGLTQGHPAAFDFQPMVPWLGVVFIGTAIGSRLASSPPMVLPAITQPLGWMGRHSLLIYMAHVPVLLGLVELVVRLSR